MGDRNLPTEEEDPDHVEDHPQDAIRVLELDDLFAEWGKGRETQLDRLDAERNPDQGQAQDQAANDVAQSREEATEDQPDDVAEKRHASALPFQ